MGDLWETVIAGYNLPTNATTHYFNKFNKLQQRTAFEATESLGFSAGSLAGNPASNLICDSDTKENRVIISQLCRINSLALVIDGNLR